MIVVKVYVSYEDHKIDEIFTIDLTFCSKFQIDDEEFVNFCGLLGKHKLYLPKIGGTSPQVPIRSYTPVGYNFLCKIVNLTSTLNYPMICCTYY